MSRETELPACFARYFKGFGAVGIVKTRNAAVISSRINMPALEKLYVTSADSEYTNDKAVLAMAAATDLHRIISSEVCPSRRLRLNLHRADEEHNRDADPLVPRHMKSPYDPLRQHQDDEVYDRVHRSGDDR
jgi:hypothetical protein